eukprot:1157210-Pelagomonas_calceolata.AAC.4
MAMRSSALGDEAGRGQGHAPLLVFIVLRLTLFALRCRTIFNGNGKLPWELELAVDKGVLINIDSEFDFDNIKAAAKKLNKPAKTLLRINPDVDPEVRDALLEGCSYDLQCTRAKVWADMVFFGERAAQVICGVRVCKYGLT